MCLWRAESAIKLFEDMTRVYRIEPNTVTFNALVNICVELKDLEKGLELLHMMPKFNVRPSTATFNTLASICAKTRDVEKGLELLRRMQTDGISPDNLTFTSLLSACRCQAESDKEEPHRKVCL